MSSVIVSTIVCLAHNSIEFLSPLQMMLKTKNNLVESRSSKVIDIFRLMDSIFIANDGIY